MRRAREIREARGFSLNDVIRVLPVKISGPELSRFERGEQELGRRKLLALAELYHCSVEDLWAEAEPAVV